MATVSAYDTADEGSLERQRGDDLDPEDEETPRKPRDVGAPDAQTLQAPSPTPSEPTRQRSVVQEAEEIPKNKDVDGPSVRANVRPHALRSRQASYRSSASSFTTTSIRSEETSSDATLGADYALQSGGAAPENSSAHRHNPGLSRSTSLGSIASGMTGIEEPTNNWDKARTASGTHFSVGSVSGHVELGLSTLDEERDPQAPVDAHSIKANDKRNATSSEETPKASGRMLTAPTDTVIAQHVRNVQVPASVAREYRERHPPVSPEKKSEGRTSLSGRGEGLTLKEQSSTIDRLQKENFDLKLKIHYLNKALNERSDEGIKQMISENVELKVGLATMEKQNRTLRRTVAELERKLNGKEEVQTDLSPLSGESDEDARRSTRSKPSSREIEEEVIYLRQRVEVYEREIERLMSEGDAKEGERRRLAELIRSFGEKKRAYFDVGAREEMVSVGIQTAMKDNMLLVRLISHYPGYVERPI